MCLLRRLTICTGRVTTEERTERRLRISRVTSSLYAELADRERSETEQEWENMGVFKDPSRIGRSAMRVVASAMAICVSVVAGSAIGAGSAGAAAPPGYNSPDSLLVAQPGTVSSGSVKCASGTVAWGGGVGFLGSNRLSETNVKQSSALSGGAGWKGSVNNQSGSTQLFAVYALCADRPTTYQILDSGKINNPAGTRAAATTRNCPNGTVVLGGGVVTTGGLGVDLNESLPPNVFFQKWSAVVDNNSGGSDSIQAQVVCGTQPPGYVMPTSPDTNVQPNNFVSATEPCPAGHTLIGGGVWSSDGIDTLSNVTEDSPFEGTSWNVIMTNQSSTEEMMFVVAICAT
jgi:hypothetical protein